MAGAAVVAVAVAILVGTLLLADLPPGAKLGGVVAPHVILALSGAALVCVAAVGDLRTISWLNLAILLATIAFGIRLYRRVGVVTDTGPSADGIERRPSTSLLIVHGTAAAAAVALVLLAAVRG